MMKQLILTHKHPISAAALKHARGMADRSRSSGNDQVYLLVADPALVNQVTAEDLVQYGTDHNEFAYASLLPDHLGREEGNHVFLFSVLPNFLNWFNPDQVCVIDPAVIGWNVVRSLRHTLPDVAMDALVTCDDSALMGDTFEDSIINGVMLQGALAQFESIRVYPACLTSFSHRHGTNLSCKPMVAEVLP